MNIELAIRNFDTLINLPENTRLYASGDDELSYDNRWFLSIRRRTDGSSREDMIVPINKTFIALMVADKKTIDELTQCIEHLRTRFEKLYPDFEKVFTFLNYLETFVRGFLGGSGALSKEEMLNNTNLLNKFIQEINVESQKKQIIDSSATMDIETVKVIEQIDRIEEEASEQLQQSPPLEDTVSDMDDTEGEQLSQLPPLEDTVSDMDDTECESDSGETEEDIHNHIKIEVVNPLLHRDGFEQYISTFEARVKNEILPRLEKETDEMLRSIEEGVRCTASQIRRRFVVPQPPSFNPTPIGHQNENEYCISIPSIPKFFDLNDELIPSSEEESSSTSDSNGYDKSCIEKWMEDLNEEINDTVDSTARLCQSIGKFMTKYLY